MAYSVITFLVPKILTFLILDLQNSNQRDYALSTHNYERRWSLQARERNLERSSRKRENLSILTGNRPSHSETITTSKWRFTQIFSYIEGRTKFTTNSQKATKKCDSNSNRWSLAIIAVEIILVFQYTVLVQLAPQLRDNNALDRFCYTKYWKV